MMAKVTDRAAVLFAAVLPVLSTFPRRFASLALFGRTRLVSWLPLSCAGNELWVELNDAAASVGGTPMSAERAIGNKKAVLLWYSRRAV
jgi:hypothetical protein